MPAAVQIARFPKENGSRARTVVITQGKDPTVIASMGKVGIWVPLCCISQLAMPQLSF